MRENVFPGNALEASRRVKFFVLAGAREICWRGKFATVNLFLCLCAYYCIYTAEALFA